MIGVSKSQFYRLSTAWTNTRDPTQFGLTQKRAKGWAGRSLPDGTRKAIGEAIATLGFTARFVEIETEVRRRCIAACVPIPSAGSVHQQLVRAREAASGRNGNPEVLVGWTSLQLPVATATGTLNSPHLLLAVHAPECRIIAHRLVGDGDLRDAALGLIDEAVSARRGRIVIVDQRLARDAAVSAAANGRKIRVSATRSLLSPWFGNRIGGLRIHHRGMRKRTENPAQPIAEAQAAILEAIWNHNRGRSHR